MVRDCENFRNCEANVDNETWNAKKLCGSSLTKKVSPGRESKYVMVRRPRQSEQILRLRLWQDRWRRPRQGQQNRWDQLKHTLSRRSPLARLRHFHTHFSINPQDLWNYLTPRTLRGLPRLVRVIRMPAAEDPVFISYLQARGRNQNLPERHIASPLVYAAFARLNGLLG